MTPITLLILDHGLYILHLLVTGFNVFGWVSVKTRRLHRWCVSITASCWLLVGMYVGAIGYCPLTDWHWQIKRMRGESDLPNSFITYILNQIGLDPTPAHVDIAVGVTFTAVAIITLALYIKEKRTPRLLTCIKVAPANR